MEHANAFERFTRRQAPYSAYTSAKEVCDVAATAGAERVDVPAFVFGSAPAVAA